jgi:hypothetical protein
MPCGYTVEITPDLIEKLGLKIVKPDGTISSDPDEIDKIFREYIEYPAPIKLNGMEVIVFKYDSSYGGPEDELNGDAIYLEFLEKELYLMKPTRAHEKLMELGIKPLFCLWTEWV